MVEGRLSLHGLLEVSELTPCVVSADDVLSMDPHWLSCLHLKTLADRACVGKVPTEHKRAKALHES